jgi:hypothetical protein
VAIADDLFFLGFKTCHCGGDSREYGNIEKPHMHTPILPVCAGISPIIDPIDDLTENYHPEA